MGSRRAQLGRQRLLLDAASSNALLTKRFKTIFKGNYIYYKNNTCSSCYIRKVQNSREDIEEPLHPISSSSHWGLASRRRESRGQVTEFSGAPPAPLHLFNHEFSSIS